MAAKPTISSGEIDCNVAMSSANSGMDGIAGDEVFISATIPVVAEDTALYNANDQFGDVRPEHEGDHAN